MSAQAMRLSRTRRFIVLLPLLAFLLTGCGINNIPTDEEQAKAKWAQVLNEYQRRADLIPNLVETVKGFAKQESTVLQQVTEARAKATQVKVDTSTITDPETLAISGSLIAIAAIFQVFDGIQGVATGVLRGTADTRVPMLIHLGGFWAVGAPVGLWLALKTDLGPRGVWWGYVAGLVTVAVLQMWRVRWRLAGEIARLQLDETNEFAVVSE